MTGRKTLRRYRPDDRAAVERLLRIGLEEQAEYAAECDPREDGGFIESELAEHLAGLESEPGCWWVATDDGGEVCACMWLRALIDRLGPYRTVRQIIVAPDDRGRGLGTRLIDLAESVARESEAVMILISALRPNPAVALYRRRGFVDFPEEYREDTNTNHVVLWKDLGISDGPIPS